MKKQAAGSEKAFFSKSGTSCNIQAKPEVVTQDWAARNNDIGYRVVYSFMAASNPQVNP